MLSIEKQPWIETKTALSMACNSVLNSKIIETLRRNAVYFDACSQLGLGLWGMSYSPCLFFTAFVPSLLTWDYVRDHLIPICNDNPAADVAAVALLAVSIYNPETALSVVSGVFSARKFDDLLMSSILRPDCDAKP